MKTEKLWVFKNWFKKRGPSFGAVSVVVRFGYKGFRLEFGSPNMSCWNITVITLNVRGDSRWRHPTNFWRTESKQPCGNGLSVGEEVGAPVPWKEFGNRSWEETASLSPRIPESLWNGRLWNRAENQGVVASLWKEPEPLVTFPILCSKIKSLLETGQFSLEKLK